MRTTCLKSFDCMFGTIFCNCEIKLNVDMKKEGGSSKDERIDIAEVRGYGIISEGRRDLDRGVKLILVRRRAFIQAKLFVLGVKMLVFSSASGV